jgi:predicted ATPase
MPAVEHDEEYYQPPAGKTAALIYYLGYQGSWVSRDNVLFLLWPDVMEDKARRNLSRLLHSVKALPYMRALEAEVTRLRWLVPSDAQQFKRANAERHWSQAVELYDGELFGGFELPTSLEFKGWLENERQDLAQTWRAAALKVVEHLEKSQRHTQAAELLAKLRQHGFQDVTISSPQRSEEAMSRSLAIETQPPHPYATTEQPLTTMSEAAQPTVDTMTTPHPLNNLPQQATTFIGRRHELAWLMDTLREPSCRLLTLVGPGGIGKTRLALEAARQLAPYFPHGVWFVPLAEVTSPETITYAIADALGFIFYGPQEPEAQLLEYLASRRLLLILDNLEHLRARVAIVGHMLARTQGISVLATSRERLNLQAEWVIDVPGLQVPSPEERDVERFDAVTLFLQTAHRVRPAVAFSAPDLAAIVGVCRLVEGMPLAIELAANWLRALTPEGIHQELLGGIDFLQSPFGDLPDRHRSIRRVLEHSWARLTEDEQEALQKLSTFAGGVDRDAAEAVAAVSLRTLTNLVEKSFLTVMAGQRYKFHPLVYEYAREKLAALPDVQAECRSRHVLYYLRLLERSVGTLLGSRCQEALALMDREFDNIHVAWRWAVKQADVGALRRSHRALRIYYDRRARFQEGLELFAFAAKGLDDLVPQHHAALGALLIEQAWFCYRRGQHRRAQSLVQRGLDRVRPFAEERLGLLAGLNTLGGIAVKTGAFEQAKHRYIEALTLAKEQQEMVFVAYALDSLGTVATCTGDGDDAKARHREALGLHRYHGDHYGTILSLTGLARVEVLLEGGRGQEALARLDEGLGLLIEHDLQTGFSELANLYARVHACQGAWSKAESWGQRALATAQTTGDQTNATAALNVLGKIAAAQAEYLKAEVCLRRSLAISWPLGEVPKALESLLYLAEVYLGIDRQAEAATWLGLIREHVACEYWVRLLARERLVVLESPQIGRRQTGGGPDLHQIVSTVLARHP